jgi:hypothetical protein
MPNTHNSCVDNEIKALADDYLKRLNDGEFRDYAEMHSEILHNVVNTEYGRMSNDSVTCFWCYINSKFD